MSSTTRSVLSTIESPSTVARRLSVVRRHWRQLGLHVIFLAISVLYLLPLLWMLSTSLTLSGRELSMPPHFIPDPIVWHNYLEAVTVEPMLTFLRNTLLIGVTATSAGLLSSSLAGYAFARLRFPGRDLLFGACLATLMLPGVVTLIPQFLVFKEVGWIGTFWPLIVPPSLGGGAFMIFLFRQYALTIPLEIDEAARVDGANAFQIWWSLILPLAEPVLATIAVLSFIYHWNDFLQPLVYLQSPKLYTLAVGLSFFQGEYQTEWNLMMAAAALMLLPIVILFFFAQRYFVQGIVMTGIKG